MLKAGLDADLPCVVMSQVSLPGEVSHATTLVKLGELEPGPAPLLVLAGWPLANRAADARADFVQAEFFQDAINLE
jgi:hypothetical protein